MILAGYVLSFQYKSVWLAWELLTRRGSLSMFLQRRRLVQRSVQWRLHSLLCGAPLHTNSPQSFSNSISSLCQWRRRALQSCESEHTLRSQHAFRRIKLPCADNSDGEIRTRVESHGLWGEVRSSYASGSIKNRSIQNVFREFPSRGSIALKGRDLSSPDKF